MSFSTAARRKFIELNLRFGAGPKDGVEAGQEAGDRLRSLQLPLQLLT